MTDASEITCASMGQAELRDCLLRQMASCAACLALAQEALLDRDDGLAIALLRRLWLDLRVGISPMATELGALWRARADE